MLELGDMVVAMTGDGEQEGRIVGRAMSATPRYDVQTASEVIVNVPERNVQPAAPTAKPAPLAAPSTKNVSQSPREKKLCRS